MKPYIVYLTLASMIGGVAASKAHADNVDVENGIKSRSDVSTFYQALVNTGVNHELQPGMTYTVFAPTNEAMARITQADYPCFYMTECRAEVANIVRNHIAPGEIHVDDKAHYSAGAYSINRRFVTMGELSRNDYTVDGNPVLSAGWFPGGLIYKIDGVIANKQELSALQFAPEYRVAEVTTTTERVITPITPGCGPAGCADSVTRTTTVQSVAPYPVLAPGR